MMWFLSRRLSNHLIKPTNHAFYWCLKSYNSWAAAIRSSSSSHKALHIYSQMHRQCVPFDSFSILFTLKSCTQLHNHATIQHLHSHIVKLGFDSHVYVATALLHAYVVVSFVDACKLFDEMPEKSTVTWNTMISGYSRTGNVERATLVFEEMPVRDVASWCAMIAAYVNNGKHELGLSLFRDMVMAEEGVKPDQVTAVVVLSGCAHLGSVGLLVGKSVHGLMVKNRWEMNAELGTVLISMYAKCGFLKGAEQVFELMQEKNVMAWTALICGSAQHGYSKEALCLFETMHKAGVRPNELTFTGVLSACVNTGLVDEGRKYFNLIEESGLELRIQHYGCMVDLYGKVGLLEEAYDFIKNMKLEPNIAVWGAFLSACKEHKQFEMAERVVEQVMKMVKPENDSGVYSLIADLYVLGGKWNDAERVRSLMVNHKVRKVRGSSFIQVDGR
ncbi:pentatricopeptide repeat-containing protein At5g66520 [Rosa chinensis]|nr:pentatricopeptide repeat-containing protein At5g66520 [Rosa chinensis]XP_040366379.1 pentatricopeptide repeat-containing protein At5g66520 [Rosa chinensis]XP_040366380.1 pentatricopeptide repeat-containing protein At5g66520 [Rosa chinensis]XP_040366381.1 pentatricopeptide repeat-containing protein At5g66520 [Rosa chinensis]XP_040366382.1 pentatricopeptide repeat-containing protein At5g66520 [Rosa chinensis]XP_040366383.1 pentatricopeptide repeat-containing protein At5g66520 [Rosa chinensis]